MKVLGGHDFFRKEMEKLQTLIQIISQHNQLSSIVELDDNELSLSSILLTQKSKSITKNEDKSRRE